MRNTFCFSGLRSGLVGSALVAAGLLLAAPALAASPSTHKNSIGMEFVLIPAGTFQMGCSPDTEECDNDEKPRHEVTISKPFYLGKYEVTQAQWEAVMGNNPSWYKGADRPVEDVSRHDVQEFIRKLNAKEGRDVYRLPTEAEWEYAARAGSTTAYSFGNDDGQLGNYAWYGDNSGDETHPVGQKRPNEWGLYDVHGNVLEWVQDWHGSYSAGAVTDPLDSGADEYIGVLRGGSFGAAARRSRSACRYDFWPYERNRRFGFRLVFSSAAPVPAAPPPPTPAASAALQTHTNSIGMEFALIPAGTFQMGCSSEAEECNDDEKPRHEVTISKSFFLGKYEVTQSQWETVMGNNPSKFKGADRPVENVSWNDVQEFIRKLNAKEGREVYRLPTEAEWEYAARAGSAAVYGFGDDTGQLGDYAWYLGNSGGGTHPVGRKRANAWGLFDMHGNVWEWVADWYDGSYYSSGSGAVTDPKGPGAGEERVLRGGSWLIGTDRDCRAAMRVRGNPGGRGKIPGHIGFRLALTPER